MIEFNKDTDKLIENFLFLDGQMMVAGIKQEPFDITIESNKLMLIEYYKEVGIDIELEDINNYIQSKRNEVE